MQVLPAVTHISLPERFNIDKIVALSDSVIIAAGGTKNEYGAIFRTRRGRILGKELFESALQY